MYKLIALITLVFASAAHAQRVESTPYPNDVKVAFFKSCVGLHKEMIQPCKCMTLAMEKHIPYEEYLQILKMKDPKQHPKFVGVANACLKQARP